MNSNLHRFFVINVTIVFFVLISAAFVSSESTDTIVKGDVEEVTDRYIKLKGWFYQFCPVIEDAEDKGFWVYNPSGAEIGKEGLALALKAKVYIKKGERCAWKIKALEFAR